MLRELLSAHTSNGELYRRLDDGRVECFACGHRCRIGEGREGICKIRFHRNGELRVPSGYVSSIAVDPIEKKPFFHVLPGASALSFGMLGCDFHCPFCQNWITSQTLRDPHAISSIETITSEEIVAIAKKHKASIITSTYNEPLITSEWSIEIFKLAKKARFLTSFVSNGNGTPEVIEYIRPWLDLFKIDLKSFRKEEYKKMGGVLNNVLDTIRLAAKKKFWIEIVTLIIPAVNDSEEELRDIARFIVTVSPDIPWHVTAYHADYNMTDTPSTPARTLLGAIDIGYEEGLHYVYAGNIPGGVKNYESTYCHSCHELLVERRGYHIIENRMKGNSCPKCHTVIPGIWIGNIFDNKSWEQKIA
jgi:pyruvate formate lyase activating enzyme